MIPTTVFVIGIAFLILAFTLQEKQNGKLLNQLNQPNPDFENTNHWNEIQFYDLANPIFREFNNDEFHKNKYWVRYDVNLNTREHVVREMYNQTCVWEWRRPIQSVKISNINILTGLKERIVNELCRANEYLLRQSFDDEKAIEFHERIKTLNP